MYTFVIDHGVALHASKCDCYSLFQGHKKGRGFVHLSFLCILRALKGARSYYVRSQSLCEWNWNLDQIRDSFILSDQSRRAGKSKYSKCRAGLWPFMFFFSYPSIHSIQALSHTYTHKSYAVKKRGRGGQIRLPFRGEVKQKSSFVMHTMVMRVFPWSW